MHADAQRVVGVYWQGYTFSPPKIKLRSTKIEM